MIKNLYSVFDSCAGFYNDPVIVVNDALAIRSFGDMCQRPDSIFAAHPADYTLYCVGAFDSDSGTLIHLTAPRMLVRASDFVSSDRTVGGAEGERVEIGGVPVPSVDELKEYLEKKK